MNSQILWSQPTTQGHKLSITNGEGKAIIVLRATTANKDIDVNFQPALICDGLKIDDLDRGTVYLYRR